MPTPLRSWSFTALTQFEDCPRAYELKYIQKISDTKPRDALERGSRIHQEAEDFVRGKVDFTENLRHFKPELEALKTKYQDGKVTVEEEWGFDAEWYPTAWRSAWVRLKCDAVVELSPEHFLIVDYKTGGRFGNELKHGRQLEFYAAASLVRFPDVKQVTCELWYLDKNDLASMTMNANQMKRALSTWDRAGRKVSMAKHFPATPSLYKCRWCPYKDTEHCEQSFKEEMKDSPLLKRLA
jgi:RecB family exonuclease